MQLSAGNKSVNRASFIRNLRKIHGWFGLWGAAFGLLFGISGFLLNHRAILKVPAVQIETSEVQVEISKPLPINADEFGMVIQKLLNINHVPEITNPEKVKKQKQETILKDAAAIFLGKQFKQPEHWQVVFQLPQARVEADYVSGNQFATVKREDANIWGFITRMHKGTGANAAWVLLVDSFAGALIMLSVTGTLLWTKMRNSRLVMLGLIGGATSLIVICTLFML